MNRIKTLTKRGVSQIFYAEKNKKNKNVKQAKSIIVSEAIKEMARKEQMKCPKCGETMYEGYEDILKYGLSKPSLRCINPKNGCGFKMDWERK